MHEYLPGILHHNVDRLVQDYSNSNASALGLLQSRNEPSICGLNRRNEGIARVLSVNRQKAPLTLGQCSLAGPVYTGMPLECHWLTQCTLGYHWATQRMLAGYTGTPLEKLCWNSPTLGCHWRNSSFCTLHWNTIGGTVTVHTRPETHIVKHAE